MIRVFYKCNTNDLLNVRNIYNITEYFRIMVFYNTSKRVFRECIFILSCARKYAK